MARTQDGIRIGYSRESDPAYAAAELFAALLRKQDISVGSGFQGDRVRPSDTLLYTYHSKLTLAEMIRGCLKFSNNFIANQIFLTTGTTQFAPPPTWPFTKRSSIPVIP